MENQSEIQINEFILVGFQYSSQTKTVLFVVLLLVYMINLTANCLFIIITVLDSQLHSPMYFFLCHLSFLDIWYSSVAAPTVLTGLLVDRIKVTYFKCMLQSYIHLSLGQTECFLMAVMAWDRYVAICKPLNYPQIMTNRGCIKLAVTTWAGGFVYSLSSVIVLPWVHFCGHNIIDHTLCEAEALARITCMDNKFFEFFPPVLALVSLVAPTSLILFTYCRIIYTILSMPTAESRHRTFATCGSHLVAVTLSYGMAMVIYMKPKSARSSEKDKSIALFYELVVPAINPFIYTLRNTEVKGALKKHYIRNNSCQRLRA